RVRKRTDDFGETAPPCRLGRLKSTTDGTDVAREPELTDEKAVPQACVRRLLTSHEDAKRENEIEAGSLLAHVRRSEVRGDPGHRVLLVRVRDGAAHPVPRFLNGCVGQADD